MKKIGDYTIRGSVTTDREAHRLILFDGKFDTGYKVTSMTIFPSDLDDGTFRSVSVKLASDELNLTVSPAETFNCDSNSEIAWAQFQYDNSPASNPYYFGPSVFLDPDNFTIEDLYLYPSENSADASIKVNYIITLEKYDVTDWKGALTMVRNRSQG